MDQQASDFQCNKALNKSTWSTENNYVFKLSSFFNPNPSPF